MISKNEVRRLAIVTQVLLLFLLYGRTAAATFAPIRCSSTTPNIVPYTFDSAEFEADRSCTSNCPHYARDINATRTFLANKFVNRFGFFVVSFDTELNYDKLSIIQLYSTSPFVQLYPTVWSASGTLPSSVYQWVSNSASSTAFLSQYPMVWNFSSDLSFTRTGFSIRGVDVRCAASGEGAIEPQRGAELLQRQTGVLLGTGDVVYQTFPTRPSNERMRIALWGNIIGSSVDFDLYARCNAVPTESEYTIRAFTSSVQEFLELPTD